MTPGTTNPIDQPLWPTIWVPIVVIVGLIGCCAFTYLQSSSRSNAEATQQAATVEARQNASAVREATVTAATTAAHDTLSELAENDTLRDQLVLLQELDCTDPLEDGTTTTLQPDGVIVTEVIEFSQQHADFAFVAVLKPDGCVHGFEPDITGNDEVDVTDTQWFLAAASGEEYTATGTDRDFSDAQGIITALPVFDGDTVIGVVMGVWRYE